MWNLFVWRGAERHPFITVCTVAYTLLSLCANSLVYLGYPRHKTICEHTGISCLFARLHKKPTSRGDRTHSSPKHTARASSLERYWKEFCRSKQTLTGNLLLQLLLCNVGEHPPQISFWQATLRSLQFILLSFIMPQQSTENIKGNTPCSSTDKLLYNVSKAELITFLLYIHLSLNLFLGLSVHCREEWCENSYEVRLGAWGWRVLFHSSTTNCIVSVHEPWSKLIKANSQVFSTTQFTYKIKRAINWEHILLHYFWLHAPKILTDLPLRGKRGKRKKKKRNKKFLHHLNWIYSHWQLSVLCFTLSFHWQETANSRAFSEEPKRGGSLLDRVISLARSSADNHFHWRCCKVAHNSFLLYNKCRTIKSSSLWRYAQNSRTIHHCLPMHNSAELTPPAPPKKKKEKKKEKKKRHMCLGTLSHHIFPQLQWSKAVTRLHLKPPPF